MRLLSLFSNRKRFAKELITCINQKPNFPKSSACSSSTGGLRNKRHSCLRSSSIERMEQRILFNADPIWVGGVYIEEDQGSDLHGDSFYISFTGGAPNTTLKQVIIDGDQGTPGFNVGDNFFDTVEAGLGADHAYPFKIVRLEAADPNAKVTAQVVDGSTKLVLNFENFRAGDLLVFEIDVDEVEFYDPSETNLDTINSGFDPITSGVEFQTSAFKAYFAAPHYQDVDGATTFWNLYDSRLAGSNLNLPADNANGLRDRTAGTAFTVTQVPKPISIAGNVFVDNNLNLVRDSGEQALSGVRLELFRKQGSLFVSTGHTTNTDVNGRYEFGIDLNLMPGTYEVRETQPNGYYSVGAVPGKLNTGASVGSTVLTNKDVLTQIDILLGDLHAVELNFAEAQPTSISGFVYQDRDNDGLRETGEAGIAGVPIRLESISTLTGEVIVRNATTAADGSYSFSSLPPGTYRVIEVQQPANFIDGKDTAGRVGSQTRGTVLTNDAIQNIQLFGNDVGIEYNFGELTPAEISGHVFEDLNDDGIRQPNEPMLAGVRIDLYDANGQLVRPTLTDSSGFYSFSFLSPGVYQLRETTPVGFLDGKDIVGTIGGQKVGVLDGNDQISTIVLASGDSGINYDFGEVRPSELCGQVIVDFNDNNLVDRPNEAPIAGVTIQLLDAYGNVVQTTTTDANGDYCFTNIRPGRYSVREIQPSGYLNGKTYPGSHGGDTSIPDNIRGIQIDSGTKLFDYDFTELIPAQIAGHVFIDSNGDCLVQPGERGLENVRVDLVDENGTVLQTTRTRADGSYEFTGLLPGRYAVREFQPAGYLQGGQRAGSGGGDASIVDLIQSIDVFGGENLVEYNFCELQPASLGGTVYVDTDGDCVQDENEVSLAGVRVELLDGSGQVIDFRITDSQGNYRFENLQPGRYSVREIQPAGYFQGGQTAPAGRADTSVADLISSIDLLGGESLDDLDFCEMPPATISGYVFQDGATIVNESGEVPNQLRPLRDGSRDAGDKPIAGVILELRLTNGQPYPVERTLSGTYSGDRIRVTTDANGYFEFTGLRAGVYSVYQIQPEDYIDGLDTPGSTGGVPINAEDLSTDPQAAGLLSLLALDEETNPRNDAILLISLAAGQRSIENNFSEVLVVKEKPPTPLPPPNNPPPEVIVPPFTPPFYPSIATLIPPATPPGYLPDVFVAGFAAPEYTWHLSIINAGTPRGSLNAKNVNKAQLADVASMLDVYHWKVARMRDSEWSFVSAESNRSRLVSKNAFDVPEAIPLAGDFNGDSVDELALYLEGEWLIDVNGNGRWDDGDMWAKLGEEDDLPVIGDWDGDGKDDIGVFGPEWEGDDEAIEKEVGLPDSDNHRKRKPKNIPVDEIANKQRERWLQRSTEGPGRKDVIDHTFRHGTRGDKPVAGDFNGDGISTVGIFHDGQWRLDSNGDGKWNRDVDQLHHFGKAGDIPVVGDFDGDGIDEIAVIRGSKLMVDSNHNGREDATDRIFELESEIGQYVIGDFDGDGIDQAALHRDQAIVEKLRVVQQRGFDPSSSR